LVGRAWYRFNEGCEVPNDESGRLRIGKSRKTKPLPPPAFCNVL
jgi:hypothetical protein